MPNPNFVPGGPPGWVVAAFQYAVGQPDRNSTTDAQIRLANQAGYTRADGYTRPQQIAVGQGLMSADAFALGQGAGPGGDRAGPGPPVRNLPVVVPPPPPTFYPPTNPAYQPPPPGSGGSGSSGQGLPPRGSPPGINPNAPPPPGFPSMWPYVIGQVAGPTILDNIFRANDYAMAAWRVILGGPRPIPKGPPTRNGPRGNNRGNEWDDDPRNSPWGPPQVTVNVPAPREPRADRLARIWGELGGDIYVDTRRLPIPKQPTPAPAPPAKVPLWLTLLPIFGPSLMQFIRPDQGARNIIRLTDPLTQPQTPTIPGLTTNTTTLTSYAPFGGSPGAVGTNTCECKAPRKKGRKKKRTVCYTGTFTEKADGLRKVKKRKVPCK